MTRNTLLLAAITNLMIINNACAMDTKGQIVPLNNGLLTTIPGIVCTISFKNPAKNVWGVSCNPYVASRSERTDTVLNLLSDRVPREYYNLPAGICAPCAPGHFLPLLYKLQDNNTITRIGQFDKKIDKEAKEAIRQNKALYYAIGRGAIIYSIQKQPSAKICATLAEELEKILLDQSDLVFSLR